MTHFLQLFHVFDSLPFLVLGWTLFGASKDTQVTNKSENYNYDFTDASTNTDARQTNTSTVSNDTRIANTALQLTDAFNRFSTLNLANVGNTTIGGTSGDDAKSYVDLFKAFPQPPRGLNDADPNAWNSGIDFAAISKIATENIKASGDVSKGVLAGFSQLVPGGAATSATSSMVKWVVVAVVAMVALFLFLRRGKK